MNNLVKRAITGITLASVITAAVCINVYSFIALVFTLNLFSLLEFYNLFSSDDIKPGKTAGITQSCTLFFTVALHIGGAGTVKILLLNVPVAFGIFISELYRRAAHPFGNLAFTFLGVLYITVPLCFFTYAAFLPAGSGLYHWQISLGYFCILWAADSGAYFTGKILGSHPLFKRISPKKTWEGSAGGAACALVVSYTASYYFTVLNTVDWLCIAGIIIVTGTFGDLIKSMMKRSLNVKDSGTILPGHGGMLDRFDTLLGSAPFVFCYLILFSYA